VQLEKICEEGGLPFARIQTPSDLFEDPHLNAGGAECPSTLPDGQRTMIPALPMQFGSERLALRTPLPRPGEHNQEILGPLGVKVPQTAATH
jgi:crotonobetainyl-CoA:carnitine CoA-transferase CaiB-like acyl-CoA transferase